MFSFLNPLNLRPQIRLTDDVVAVEHGVRFPAGQQLDSASSHALSIHFPGEASSQIVRHPEAFQDLDGRLSVFVEDGLTAANDRRDNAGEASFVAGGRPSLTEVADGLSVIGKDERCQRCGHAFRYHHMGTGGACMAPVKRGFLGYFCGCHGFKQRAKFPSHRDNSALPVLIPSDPDSDFVPVKVHAGPLKLSSLPDTPARQEQEQHELSKHLGQISHQTPDFLFGEESFPNIVFLEHWDMGGMQQFPAFQRQVERVAHQFKLSIDRAGLGVFALPEQDVASNLGGRDLGSLAAAEDGNQVQAETGFRVGQGSESVDLVIGQDIIGQFAKQNRIGLGGNGQAGSQLAQADRQFLLGFFACASNRFRLSKSVGIDIPDPKRKLATLLNRARAFAHLEGRKSTKERAQ